MAWTHKQLAMVSVVQRERAAKNPRATFNGAEGSSGGPIAVRT